MKCWNLTQTEKQCDNLQDREKCSLCVMLYNKKTSAIQTALDTIF